MTGTPGGGTYASWPKPRPLQQWKMSSRVPDAEETAHSVDHAGQVLDEILYRDGADAAEEVDDRTDQLTRWYSDDQEVATVYESAGWGDADE